MQDEKTKKVFKSLNNGIFRKIICGASNTSEKQVERLSLVYSLCGADVIDISAQKGLYNAAKKGILKALAIAEKHHGIYPEFNVPAIMKSVNVGDDKHFRKANFNLSKCLLCLECVKTCQSGALSVDEKGKSFDKEKCYGCARCVETCKKNAVIMIKLQYLPDEQIYIGKYDALEIHTGNNSIEEIKTFLKSNKNIVEEAGFLSVSVDSMRFNSSELVEYTNSLIKMFEQKIIVQVDGISMRGGTKNSSTFQTIAAAAILLEAEINAYIQLAGGTNHLTGEIADFAELKISGIGYGTFAKKIILSYIEKNDETEFMENLYKIAGIAANLMKIRF